MTSSSAHGAKSLTELLSTTSIEDHEELLKAANNALKKSKQDVQAQHTRAVALLKLDRFDEALRAFEEGGSAVQQQAPLAWAYTLYKNGKLEQAQQVAASAPTERGLLHVQAQAAYRAEDFATAQDIYKRLLSAPSDEDNRSDLRINALAVEAQLLWTSQRHLVPKGNPDRDDLEAFETVFNIACAYVARGELKQAEMLLKRAKDLCNAADELTESEKKSELLPIIVQQIYVLCKLGQLEEAAKLSATIDIADSPDPATRHIAQANILSTSPQDVNPYLSHRQFHATSDLSAADRPFTFQQSTLYADALTLELQAQKFDGVARSTEALLAKETLPSVRPDIVVAGTFRAAAHARLQSGKAAIKKLTPLLHKGPEDVGLVLTVVQQYVALKKEEAASNVLETFFKRLEALGTTEALDVRYAPGLVAVFAALCTLQGHSERLKTELVRSASHWRERSKNSDLPVSLLTSAGTALLRGYPQSNHEASYECFTAAYEKDTSNQVAIAGLVASSSDPSATGHVDSLPSAEELTAGIDVDALEAGGIARPPQAAGSDTSASKKRRTGPAEGVPPKTKRVRKSRLPKDYDPSKKPDPERWLPLRDRSTYRPKGKKGKGRAGAGATQGGVVSDESRPASAGVQQAPTTNKAKKKKGKGGK